ncbi:hypothetical protein [Mesorhizobium sp. L103C131B0]|uniref:hypothetical protein n=1 Tax=Mesorhizobium sp. L103C131B0 TaxID=1287089 RepID=UPI0003D028FE|nr:hypothetical protein [Mesorhizobium sp. L103C131B0]ESZ56636.1 hypothetical protein X729_24190 [Mesorhizobium sp. L103C131B0]
MVFNFPNFSVVTDGVLIIPGTDNTPIFANLISSVASLDEAAGEFADDYVLRAKSAAETICLLPVTMVWARSDELPHRFLAFITDEEKLFETLTGYRAQFVSLRFTRNEEPSEPLI